MGSDWYGGWRPYVSVGSRRANAQRQVVKLQKSGNAPEPVQPSGRKPAVTFWGRAWCANLEAYSDYSNRLPRGRAYLNNGFVVDLKVHEGRVEALVQGSSLYRVGVTIEKLPEKTWKSLARECSGQIASVIDLLQGKLSDGVMQLISRRETGLFPAPSEIRLSCSCPDWADMCKHVAAVLYGVGTRLDSKPELLFRLRGVEHAELVKHVGRGADLSAGAAGDALAGEDLGALFGIELEAATAIPAGAAAPRRVAAERSRRDQRLAKTREAVMRETIAKPPGRARAGAPPGPVAMRAAAPIARPPAAAKPAQKPRAVVRRTPAAEPFKPRTVTSKELAVLGIARPAIEKWILRGALSRASKPGVYWTTPTSATELGIRPRRE